MLDQSSEIASVRNTSNYKKPVNQRFRKNGILIGGSRNLALSKISEEDYDESLGYEKLNVVNSVNGSCSTEEE